MGILADFGKHQYMLVFSRWSVKTGRVLQYKSFGIGIGFYKGLNDDS